MLKTQLENEEYKRAIANSDMEHRINLLGQEKAELSRDMHNKVTTYSFIGPSAKRVI